MTHSAKHEKSDRKLTLRELIDAMIAGGLIEKEDAANLLLAAVGKPDSSVSMPAAARGSLALNMTADIVPSPWCARIMGESWPRRS